MKILRGKIVESNGLAIRPNSPDFKNTWGKCSVSQFPKRSVGRSPVWRIRFHCLLEHSNYDLVYILYVPKHSLLGISDMNLENMKAIQKCLYFYFQTILLLHLQCEPLRYQVGKDDLLVIKCFYMAKNFH